MDVFDQIIAGELPAHVLLRTEQVIAFLDARPVFPGHTLVCPLRHYTTLEDVPDDLLTPIFAAARRVMLAQRTLGAQGAFIANNNTVSQSVPHFHIHVVPRRYGDGLRGFFYPRHTYQEGEAAALAERLRAALAAQTTVQ